MGESALHVEGSFLGEVNLQVVTEGAGDVSQTQLDPQHVALHCQVVVMGGIDHEIRPAGMVVVPVLFHRMALVLFSVKPHALIEKFLLAAVLPVLQLPRRNVADLRWNIYRSRKVHTQPVRHVCQMHGGLVE